MHSHAKATNVDAALVQYSPCLYTHSANKLIPVPDYCCLIVSVKVGGVLRLLQIRAVNIFVLAQRGNHGYQDFLISINKVLAMRSNRYVQVRQTPMLLFKPMRHLFLTIHGNSGGCREEGGNYGIYRRTRCKHFVKIHDIDPSPKILIILSVISTEKSILFSEKRGLSILA